MDCHSNYKINSMNYMWPGVLLIFLTWGLVTVYHYIHGVYLLAYLKGWDCFLVFAISERVVCDVYLIFVNAYLIIKYSLSPLSLWIQFLDCEKFFFFEKFLHFSTNIQKIRKYGNIAFQWNSTSKGGKEHDIVAKLNQWSWLVWARE